MPLPLNTTSLLAGAQHQAQLYAVGTLLRQGLQKLESLLFCQKPVAISVAEQAFLNNVRGAQRQQFHEQYGGSLLTALSAPPCSQLVQLHTVGGQVQAQLLVQLLAAAFRANTLQAGTAAGAAAGPLPLPIPLPQPAANGSAARQPSTAPPTPEVTSQLAALQLGSNAGPSSSNGRPNGAAAVLRGSSSGSGGPGALPEAQLVASAEAAAAAVAALLQAGEVAMDCEGDLHRDGSIALIQLYAPTAPPAAAPGQLQAQPRCYVFDLAGMEEGEREGALRQLARLLEAPDVVKVRGTWAGR